MRDLETHGAWRKGDNGHAHAANMDTHPVKADSETRGSSAGNSMDEESLEYLGAPLPANEEERRQALCGLEVLDTPTRADERFDDVTKLLCEIFHLPVAIVSLVDKDRQWFKSVQGLPVNSTERRASFCAWTLLPEHPEILVVPDAMEDVRFAENPLVLNEPFIRFYAGAPLVTSSGHRLGSLCVIDRKPRELEAQSCNVLINFAEIVVRELEKDQAKAQGNSRLSLQSTTRLRKYQDHKEGIMVCSSTSADLEILFFNDAWTKLTGMDREEAMGHALWDLFDVPEEKEAEVLEKVKTALADRKPFTVQLRLRGGDEFVLFNASFRPGVSDSLDENTPAVAIPGLMSTSTNDGITEDLYFCTIQKLSPASSSSSTCTLFREAASSKPAFDSLELGCLLGQGSYGKVYRGIWEGKEIAVKVIQPPMPRGISSAGGIAADSADKSDIDRGAMECALMAKLKHPHVISTFESKQVPLNYEVIKMGEKVPAMESWLLLELCNAGTLSYAVERGKFDEGFIKHGRRSRKPHVPFIKETAEEVASAMRYVHEQDIVHGDLCAGNVLLCSASSERGFTAKVADFGLGRDKLAEPVNTHTYGTVTHMPPELLVNGDLSKACDTYAFGALLWEMFCGERPWPNMLPMQVIYQTTVLGRRLEMPATVPDGYRSLGERCLDADPSERPTFNEILTILKEL